MPRLHAVRSLLYIPGNRPRFFLKLAELRPDVAILDLEDAVPEAEKSAARDTVRAALPTIARPDLGVFVRMNVTASGLARDDVARVVSPALDGIVIPKVETADDVRQVATWLDLAECDGGLASGSIKLIAILETVRGALNACSIAQADSRLLGLAFGSEDFSRDLGVERTPEGVETLYPRSQVALAAHASGLQAFDTPWTDIADVEGLRRETIQGRQLGYGGKQVIHPSQIELVHQALRPSAEQIQWAKRAIEAYEGAVRDGRGAIQLDSKLLDVPMIERARRTLAQAGESN